MFTEWPGYFKPPEHVLNLLSRILQLDNDTSEDEWVDCLDELGEYDGFLSNDEEGSQVFPSKRWTFLHHVAKYHAPVSVITAVKERKFVMSLKDSEGKTAYDHLDESTPDAYKELFKAKYKMDNIDLVKLSKIEKQFHAVILSRVEDLVKKHNLILPMISILLETITDTTEFYFGVPGMYGGFTMCFIFNEDKTDVKSLETSSWCRVAGGSGQKHCCTEDGFTLLDEGFV